MLHISALTYRLGERLLIDNATAALPSGAHVGLVGRNGAGKTTLFRILRGELAPETGAIMVPKGARVGSVDQEAPAGAESLVDFVLSADVEREALMTEAETASDPERIAEIHTRLVDIEAHNAPARAARILKGLGFDEAAQARSLGEFSGGWRMRVALAAVLFSEPDLLLLDEPTNYLDLEGVLWLTDYLKSCPATILVISHDRDLLDDVAQQILHLDRGKLTLWSGGYSSFERQRHEQQILAGKAAKKQEEKRAHLQAFVDRFRAKASKAVQAQSRLKMLAKMAPIAAIVDDTVQPFKWPPVVKRLSPPIVTMDKVSAGYDGRAVIGRIDLSLADDDRIGLSGQVDVRHVVGLPRIPLAREHGPVRQGLQGHRRDELRCCFGHNDLDSRAGLDEFAREIGGLVAGDAARQAEHDVLAGEFRRQGLRVRRGHQSAVQARDMSCRLNSTRTAFT